MKYPETDPATYRGWKEEGWKDIILAELKKLLLFVRWQPICGLEISKIRVACYTPFGVGDLYNRKVWLYMNEIEAYNDRYKNPVDEDAIEEEWNLSGQKRPAKAGQWVMDENQQWRQLDSRGKYI